jgi:catechol 2,3-dioxygenase-like lactoylglutathione lyase family enzyme
MLSAFTPSVTVAVKNLKAVRSFYEGILGFQPIGSTLRGAQAFKVGGGTVVIYESQFAGTNQATAVTWTLGEHFDDVVKSLDAKGVPFEHYKFPGVVLEGHVHVVKEGGPSRVAWFKDPDGNLHNLNNASPA